MLPSGLVFYKDEYDTQYKVEWSTINNVTDITSYIFQPYIWGQASEGYIVNGILYKKGIVTITRQALKSNGNSYEIIAEGEEQFVDDIQMIYPCGGGPTDNFKYHFNNITSDLEQIGVIDGSCWSSPEDASYSVWGDIDSIGNPLPLPGSIILYWVDIWSN